MNSERPTTVENSPSLRQGFFEQVEDLRLTHESEDYLMREAVAVLRKENQLQKYEELFLRAGELHEWIEDNLHLLTERNDTRLYSAYDEQLMSQIREKDREFNAIKDEIVKILASFGYSEAEVTEEVPTPVEEASPSVSEEILPVQIDPVPQAETIVATETAAASLSSQENNQLGIEELTELYRTANPDVLHLKEFEKINDEIKNVLIGAGFNKDMVSVFMNDTVNRYRHETRELAQKLAAESESLERQKISSEIKQKYQDLLVSVAGFMHTEKVDESEGLVDGELPTEGLDNLDSLIQSALQEFNLLKESGRYTEGPAFAKASRAVELLNSYAETDPARASVDKEIYLRKLQGALAELKTEDIASETPILETVDTEAEVAEPAVAEAPAEAVAEAPLVPVEEVLPETLEVPSAEGVAGEKKHEALFKVKGEYREKQQAYKEALADFYEKQKSKATIQSQIGAGFRKITGLGLSPELPPAILAMQNEYKQLRAVYADSLNQALAERSQREGNKEHSLKSDSAKIAFGKKFILEPNQEIVALQETAILSPEVKEVLGRVMKLMAKHKWATRIGIVTAAGIVGGLSGGAGFVLAGAGAGASFQASKMALSAGAGAAAGYGANRLTQGGVDKASTAFEGKSKEFTLADLDAFETELITAESDLRSAKTRQKMATIGAAVLAGGTTGYSLASVDVDSYLPQNREGLSKEAVDRIVADEIAAEAVVEPAPTKPPVAEVTPPVSEPKPEMIIETVPEFKIKPFTMPFYGFSGNLQYETVFSGIKIDGTFTAGELPEATRLELEKHIKLSMDDSLHAHPNIAEEKLEAEVLAKVQAKFGSAPWYASAGITKIDIEGMSVRPYTIGGVDVPAEVSEKIITGGKEVSAAIGSTESTYTEASPVRSEAVVPQEKISGSYVVQKGDTLSEITEKRFAGLLKDIPASKQGIILDELFRNIQADADLRGSLGIRSGDVDLIYAGEKVNLDGVEAELTRLVGREQILENFRTSGPLSVEADAEVKNVPITVVEKPIPVPAAVEVTADSGRVYKEAVPVPVERPVAPRPFALNGQYAEQPTYKEYINKTFGSMKVFEQAVEKSVQSFDNNTYDIFERPGFFGGSNYESPYRFLGEMTLQEVTEFETQPNEQIRAFMQENNMKYDTYLAWLDQIDLMVRTLPNEAETTVADLFARYVAETQVPKVNPLIKTP